MPISDFVLFSLEQPEYKQSFFFNSPFLQFSDWLYFLPPSLLYNVHSHPHRVTPDHRSPHSSLSRSPHPRRSPHQACWPAYRSAPWWSFQHHIPQLSNRRTHPEKKEDGLSAELGLGSREGGREGGRGKGGREEMHRTMISQKSKQAKHWILMPYLSQCYRAQMRTVSIFLGILSHREGSEILLKSPSQHKNTQTVLGSFLLNIECTTNVGKASFTWCPLKLNSTTLNSAKKQTVLFKENGCCISQDDAKVLSSCSVFNVTPFFSRLL